MVTKSLRVRATDGYEDIAKINYSGIRSIAKLASKAFSLTMDEIIEFITIQDSTKPNIKHGLRAGSFNNYCRTGKVSEYTSEILYNFFEKEVPYTVFNGQNEITLGNATLIYGILMEKLNNSNIVKGRLGISENDEMRYYNQSEFGTMFIMSQSSTTDINGPIDPDVIENLEIDFARFFIKEDNSRDSYNELFDGYGLNAIIHENEEFVEYIDFETLASYDLNSLRACYDSYKDVIGIYESVIRFKEIKKES